jgi:hypothetical protein
MAEAENEGEGEAESEGWRVTMGQRVGHVARRASLGLLAMFALACGNDGESKAPGDGPRHCAQSCVTDDECGTFAPYFTCMNGICAPDCAGTSHDCTSGGSLPSFYCARLNSLTYCVEGCDNDADCTFGDCVGQDDDGGWFCLVTKGSCQTDADCGFGTGDTCEANGFCSCGDDSECLIDKFDTCVASYGTG